MTYLNRYNRKPKRDKTILGVVGMALLVPLLLAAIFGYGIVWSNTHATATDCTVEDKDRAAKAKGGSDMRVYTDCGVFSVADDWLNGQWNSADIFAGIDVGETYDFETVGWRNGFLSAFPNILHAEQSAE
jgi:hypothetical protein